MQQTSSLDPNLPWSGYDVYKEEQIHSQENAKYLQQPALLDKILISKWILLGEQERNKYVIQAQTIINHYVKGKIYTMAAERGVPLSVAHELEREMNHKVQIEEYKALVEEKSKREEKKWFDKQAEELILQKWKHLDFKIQFHMTNHEVYQNLYVQLRKTLYQKFEFITIGTIPIIGDGSQVVNIVAVYQGSPTRIYYNDQLIKDDDIPSIIALVVKGDFLTNMKF